MLLSRGHFAAMPYQQVPAFIARLRDSSSMAALALEFAILTAARTGEALGARWDGIDLGARLWTIPAERLKSRREHRVPLIDRAVDILRTISLTREDDQDSVFLFRGLRRGKPLSNMALEMVLRRMEIENATVHGFRSSFRDWCGNETNFPREVAESALAHVTGNATEQAYRRSDALDKRHALMDAWAEYCATPLKATVPA
jgi:integrase